MSNFKIFMNGLVKENPTFVLFLGMCPTLATTTSAINGLSMGLATMAVLICTNFVISCIRKLVPDMVHIGLYRGHHRLRDRSADVYVGLCARFNQQGPGYLHPAYRGELYHPRTGRVVRM